MPAAVPAGNEDKAWQRNPAPVLEVPDTMPALESKLAFALALAMMGEVVWPAPAPAKKLSSRATRCVVVKRDGTSVRSLLFLKPLI